MQKARGRLTAPTACRRTVSGSLSLPCSGFFPPFPHGTGPLSVFRSYLALRDGPRGFGQDSSCPALLRWRPEHCPVTRTGLSPSADRLSRRFRFLAVPSWTLLLPRGSWQCLLGRSYYPGSASTPPVWAPPLSLATTQGIDISFFSCRY